MYKFLYVYTNGDLLALKFVNGSGNSEVAQMLNAFVTIEIEEN